MKRIVVLGCGTMGQAIVAGLSAAGGGLRPVVVTTRRAENAAALEEKLGVPAITDNAEAVRRGDIVVLATKPQNAQAALAGPVADALEGKLLVSICAGVTTAQLASWAPEAAIIRAMPNTPCLIREGMTVICAGPRAHDEHLAITRRIFEAVGRCLVLEEKHMDAVTGLSGSGPAFACVILEALADGGVRMGLPRAVAVELAAQTFQGAARMVLTTGRHPAALKDEVTTPAGCTIAGLLTMEDGRIRSTLARTIEEATRTASGLGRSSD